jgi:DNA-binding response OmpR family regulator
MIKATILFADNDPDFLKTRSEFFEHHDYRVMTATNPMEAKQVIDQGEVELAILDLRLLNDDDDKDVSGLTVAKESSPAIPKIILTKFPTFEAVREALGAALNGLPPAVDFVAKQEGPQALLTAVRKALKLTRQFQDRINDPSSQPGVQTLNPGDNAKNLIIDHDNKVVKVEGKLVGKLTKLQFKLLAYLEAKQDRICSRDELLHHLYGDEEFEREDSALNTHISRLRKIIEPDPANPRYIVTTAGHGYKLEIRD